MTLHFNQRLHFSAIYRDTKKRLHRKVMVIVSHDLKNCQAFSQPTNFIISLCTLAPSHSIFLLHTAANWEILKILCFTSPSTVLNSLSTSHNCSRRQFFIFIFQRKRVLTFHVNHLPRYDSHEMSRLVFSEKKKKKLNAICYKFCLVL